MLEETPQFNGEMLSSGNLTYMRARSYDSTLGQFTSKDTWLGRQTNPLSQNRNTFVENNPVNAIDPSGNWPDWGGMWNNVTNGVKNTWNSAVETTKAVVNTAVNVVKETAKVVVQTVQNVVSTVTNVVSNAWNTATRLAGNAWNTVKPVTSQIQKNAEQGKAFEKEKFAKFADKTNSAEEQITIKTTEGTKIRVDAIGLDKDTGNVVINEYKSSATAPLTKNQKIGFPELESGGGVVVGKGKGIFTGGYEIPSGTSVEIIRP